MKVIPEAMLQALIAHHENGFARLAMRQAQLLQGAVLDDGLIAHITAQMAHHAAVLAELRR